MDNNLMPNVTFEEELEQAPLPEGYSFDTVETSPMMEKASFNTEEQSQIEKSPLPEGYSFEATQDQATIEKSPLPEGYALEGEEVQEPNDYSDILNLPRHVKRLGSRVIETVGDVTKATVDAGAKLADIGIGAARNLIRKVGRDTPGMQYQEDLPLTGEGSTRAIESITKPVTDLVSKDTLQKYVTGPLLGKETIIPQNKIEAVGDEVAKTITALITPSIFGKGIALGNAVKLAGVGEVSKELYKAGAKSIGFNEELGEPVKLLSMVATSFFSGKPSTDINKLYKEAEIALQEGKNILPKSSIQTINKSITQLLDKEGLTKTVKSDINEMLKKANTSKEAQSFIDLKKYVNSLYKDVGKKVTGSSKKTIQDNLNKSISNVSKTTKDNLLSWGKGANKPFVEKFFPAEELFIADKTFDKARSVLEKVTKQFKNANPSLLFMLKLGEGIGTATGFVAKKMLVKKGIELTNYYVRSPLFRAQYNSLMAEIAKGAVKIGTVESMNKTLNDLDEAKRTAASYED